MYDHVLNIASIGNDTLVLCTMYVLISNNPSTPWAPSSEASVGPPKSSLYLTSTLNSSISKSCVKSLFQILMIGMLQNGYREKYILIGVLERWDGQN